MRLESQNIYQYMFKRCLEQATVHGSCFLIFVCRTPFFFKYSFSQGIKNFLSVSINERKRHTLHVYYIQTCFENFSVEFRTKTSPSSICEHKSVKFYHIYESTPQREILSSINDWSNKKVLDKQDKNKLFHSFLQSFCSSLQKFQLHQ